MKRVAAMLDSRTFTAVPFLEMLMELGGSKRKKKQTISDLPTLIFYIQSFSLTECIGTVRVEKYRVVFVCVCVSVCLSVCLSVGARTPKLLGRFP